MEASHKEGGSTPQFTFPLGQGPCRSVIKVTQGRFTKNDGDHRILEGVHRILEWVHRILEGVHGICAGLCKIFGEALGTKDICMGAQDSNGDLWDM